MPARVADGSGSAGHRRRGHQNRAVRPATNRDEGNDEVVVGKRREEEVLRGAAFEMIVDVEHAVPAIGDRAPAGIFRQLGREGAVRRVIESGKAEHLGHVLAFLALLLVGALLLGDLAHWCRDDPCRLRCIWPLPRSTVQRSHPAVTAARARRDSRGRSCRPCAASGPTRTCLGPTGSR